MAPGLDESAPCELDGSQALQRNGMPLSFGAGYRIACTVHNYRARLVMGCGLLTHFRHKYQSWLSVNLSILAATGARARRRDGAM